MGDSDHPLSPILPATTTTDPNPTPTTSKLPFRPRKARKLSHDKSIVSAGGGGGDAGPQTHHVPLRRVLPPPARPLSYPGEIDAALLHLRAADPLLGHLIDAHDPPTFQCLHPPFHSLARSILYQQLAFKAAASIYNRFIALVGGDHAVVPDAVLALSPHQLRQIGVSARKASYLHDLASKYRGGILSDDSIAAMDDRSLFAMLTMVKGIGAWSVHMFMIFSLHRPDVLPTGDLGVRKGVQLLYGLEELPRPSQMEQLCERWRPYRSVGAWYMWRLVEQKGAPAITSSAGNPQLLPEPQPLQLTHPEHHHHQLLDPVSAAALANLG